MAPAEAATEGPTTVAYALGVGRLPRANVEDELQAKGRVAAGQDPTAAGLPLPEAVATLATSMVRAAASGRRVPTVECPRPKVVGAQAEDAGPYADA